MLATSCLLLLLLLVGAATAWPGVGIISIYFYQPTWRGTIGVQYIDGNLETQANLTMFPYPGPDSQYAGPGWHYVEVGSNNISVLIFTNSSGASDPAHLADGYAFDMAGEYTVVNGTVMLLETFDPGCPGYPPNSAEFQCYSNGHCQFLAGVCNCDPGWGCPACECLLSCNSTANVVANAAPKSVIMLFPEVATVGHCCGMCGSHAGCIAANFYYQNFSCALLSKWDNVTAADPSNPSIFVELPMTTAAPTATNAPAPTLAPNGPASPQPAATSSPLGTTPSFLQAHEYTLAAAGGGVVVLLIIGGLFVRFITSATPKDARFLRFDADHHNPTGASKLFEGKYKIIKILGKGAFGVVYLVTVRGGGGGGGTTPSKRVSNVLGDDGSGASSPHEASSNYLAMKVIHCTSDEEMMAAFTEFKALNALQGHDGIVPVVDMFMSWEVGHARTPSAVSPLDPPSGALYQPLSGGALDEQDGDGDEDHEPEYNPVSRYLCIVMEYFPEGTLEKAAVEHEDHFRQPNVALSLLRQILSAMTHSHKKNIIHRDLKPGNVLLANGATRAVLSDFGLAQDLEHTSTQAGGGTLHYLAPEQIDHRVSRKSDVWSIACIVVAIVTGHCGSKVRALFMLRSLPTFEADLRLELAHLPGWSVDLLLSMLATLPLERPSVDECLTTFDAAIAQPGSSKLDPPTLLAGLGPVSLTRPASNRDLAASGRRGGHGSSGALQRQLTSDSISDGGSPREATPR